MTTFVLVHGAWSGAHGFRRLRPLLRAAGHDVFTPSLTGIGERSHLASPLVNLTTHIHDVVNHVLYEDLSEIVLLGFSYGGMVVTGTLAHIADRIRHLVYLDALVPKDGDSAFSLGGFGPPPPISLGAPWQVTATPREYDDPAEGAFMAPRRGPQPMACFTEAVRLPKPLEDYPFVRTFIKATAESPDAPGAKAIWDAAHHAKGSPAWKYFELATTHMIASNRPGDLAALLADA